ncbi:centrosomal protein of 135 kDa isoform X2 [Glossina fuscipes]|uniref:Centrosomal protein of 135 kDa isoform X2 n=1 Tax=Glossina fuscipes TaxID=7396 RepID=A0A8U0W4V7_9MUSC|nr:centrosomal protein of 135 kDa isoform X2 [Glossina fuscipes]
MCTSDSIFKNLRQKLDVMGYNQTLPLAAVPIVGAVFEDLVKTTESLRDSKKQLIELLEEKSSWELGVEPYKCDNSRLLTECNQLHLQLIRQKEGYEEQINELHKKNRELETDKSHLHKQCQQLQNQLGSIQSKTNIGVVKSGARVDKGKKPFITAVRSGDMFSSAVNLLQDHNIDLRCTKCNAGFYHRHDGATQTKSLEKDADKWENAKLELMENIKFYRNKIEAREREILRLNELLSGGRAPNILARECCYKNVGSLNEDIDLLQREKLESLARIREYQHQMHEAMRRALNLEKFNRELQKRLDELKDAALSVETQANNEITQKEMEIEQLKQQLQRLLNKIKVQNEKCKENQKDEKLQRSNQSKEVQVSVQMEKHRFNEKLNELTQKESELRTENDRLVKKLTKLKNKLQASHKEIEDLQLRHSQHLDEDKIRLKSERDFFQKEYLRVLNKVGSEKEIDFLQSQIKSKDEELRVLRSEMSLKESQALVPCVKGNIDFDNLPTSLPSSARSGASTGSSDCVQAVILRAERERDCARNDLERVRCERDTLKEKILSMTKMHDEQIQKVQCRNEELNRKLHQAERENRDLISAHKPSEIQIILLKEEMDTYKQQNNKLREENSKLQSTYNSLKLLHEQTERSLSDSQNKLTLSESQLESAQARLNAVDSNRESSQQEAIQLRTEVAALKQTYVALEREKDKILTQLDLKTEKAYQLEYELKASKEKRNHLEKQVHDFEQQLSKLTTQTHERDSELNENSTESKSLREQIAALKISREQAIMENAHLMNNLAESQAEITTLKKLLKDSEGEIMRLKQQLRQYVQEIKKAEDLLMHKEKEREEMLEHYRSLSHDAVMLEGSNQSLENEAAECRRQLNELESEIHILKKELCSRNSLITELEDKLTSQQVHNTCLKQKLEESLDEQRLLETDLTARKELCKKLDIEKDKLNAELNELNDVRKNVSF